MKPGDSNTPEVSIIIPAYNEQDRICSTLLQIFDLTERAPLKTEIIVVDDGSIDNTREMVMQFSNRYDSLFLHSHSENLGKGAAVRTGVAAARGQYILFTDADFSYPLTRLDEILSRLREHDIVIGSRLHPESRMIVAPPVYRKLMAYIFSILVRTILDLPFRDTQCGFKGFRRDAAETLFRMSRIRGFSFDAELLVIAVAGGYRICEMPVTLVHSYGSRLSLFPDAFIMGIELVRIWYYLRNGYYKNRISSTSSSTGTE